MKQYMSKVIKQAVQEFGEDARFRNSYSGRGMYGSKCVGVEGSMNAVLGTLATVEDQYDRAWLAENAEFDSMGFNVIAYWRDADPIEGYIEQDDEDW